MTEQTTNDSSDKCVEDGIWVAAWGPPPNQLDAFTLDLATVDPKENERIQTSGVMAFHTVGCTGDFEDHDAQNAVAQAMETQLSPQQSSDVSFLFHLGDVVYKPDKKPDGTDAADDADQKQMYNAQFYAPYTDYGRCIFAIAGNHDGKVDSDPTKSAIDHFRLNYCAQSSGKSLDNDTDNRPAMIQPYIYWRLDTPLAYVIGLYSNIANGGILDNPHPPEQAPQYQWLVAQLKDVQARNAQNTPRKAVLLAVHYPPYSGATNFAQRGDPTRGPTQATNARPLGDVLQQAFAESGQRPDAVLSAHAHLYQRLTYCHADGWQVPYLVVGSGGHAPVEDLFAQCNGGEGGQQTPPFDAVLPHGLTLPAGDSVQVVAFKAGPPKKKAPANSNVEDFGFARLTITAGTLTGEFFTVGADSPTLDDSFTLDLATHEVK